MKASIVGSEESFLKGGFLPQELPALQLFRPQIGNPFISSIKKTKGRSWNTTGLLLIGS